MNALILKPGKEHALLHRHPWVFANAISRIEGPCAPGATIQILSYNRRFLARAAFSPTSQIRARVWSFDETEPIDHALFKRRIARAIAHRRQWIKQTDASRLIFGEADGLPGLVVDQYAQQLVCQFTAVGVEHWKEAIVAALQKETGCTDIYERSDAAIRTREGLPLRTGVLSGAEPNAPIAILENGVRYHVDIQSGHKTGFYLDQRDNRLLVQQLAHQREVLNCFCYTGGFSLAALKGGATHVLSVDSSAQALSMAQQHVTLNGFEPTRAEWRDADAFKTLRDLQSEGRQFDLIVLDPPKFAPSTQHLASAARAYKEINRVGLQLLRPNGLLFSYSCSGAVSAACFQDIVSDAALDANADIRILKRLSAGADHPQLARFPEGEYLKGLLVEKI
ncbi:MAG: class I SAM-dependent rRNA methyltransferase [Ottowia sp.]|nr:class I SAM-dependent rRNA methyltransferase [Ottowia sp.]